VATGEESASQRRFCRTGLGGLRARRHRLAFGHGFEEGLR
jgi:hypothetical protein